MIIFRYVFGLDKRMKTFFQLCVGLLVLAGVMGMTPARPLLPVAPAPSARVAVPPSLPAPAIDPTAAVAVPPSLSTDILRYVNAHRRGIGLPALLPNSFISSVALDHSRDMLTGKIPFGHDGFHGRIDQIKHRLGSFHVAAENVASGPMGAREVVDGWLHSPGHRRNIEGDFRLTGIGVATARNGMVYFTQIFIK
jgi:uncharacterized protein YkwD